MSDTMTYQSKLTRYLFLNLAYIIEQNRERIKYENTKYGYPDLGFAITMFRVGTKGYNYAEECLTTLGKTPVRECGVTMSVNFDTPDKNSAFRDRFQELVGQAEVVVHSLEARTPQEHYFLQTNPIIKGVEDTQNNHFILLQANVGDDVDERVLNEVLGDYQILDMPDNGPVEIRVKCYRKKWRDRLVLHLKRLGIEENI